MNRNGPTSKFLNFCASKPGFVGEIGPEDISGEGNYIITLQSAESDAVKALLYFLIPMPMHRIKR